MGANEKHAATYHGGQYTPETENVEHSYVAYRSSKVDLITGHHEFTRWLATVRAEAKAEALTEVANAFQYKAWAELIQGNMQQRLRIAQPITDWLRDRAKQYKEGK